METELVTIFLNPKQVQQWIMLQFLDSLGVFDIKSGRVIIDFNPLGEIGNVDIVRHYKPLKNDPTIYKM